MKRLKPMILTIFCAVILISGISICHTITVDAASDIAKFMPNGEITMKRGERKMIRLLQGSAEEYDLWEANRTPYYDWSSSDESIVRIDNVLSFGYDHHYDIVALKNGTATIIGTPKFSSYSTLKMIVKVKGTAPTAAQERCKHIWKATKNTGVKKCKKCNLVKEKYEPQAPDSASIKVTCDNSGKVTLRWTGNKSDDGYEIYRSTSKEGKYSLISNIKADQPGKMKFIDTDAVNTDKKPHALRFYKIRAYTGKNQNKKYSSDSGIVATPISKEVAYNYRVRFISQPYTGMPCAYIETNNTDKCTVGSDGIIREIDTFDIRFYDESGTLAGSYDEYTGEIQPTVKPVSTYIDNVNFIEGSSRLMVEGGYLLTFSIPNPGKYTVKVRERLLVDHMGTKICTDEKVLGTIEVRDRKAEEEAWIQGIIDDTSAPGISKKDHMKAIAGKLYSISKYSKNNSNGYLYFLEDVNLPYFIQREWDSYTTPKMLVDFGKRIDYPLENLFSKYKRGTNEWLAYHYYAYSKEDDEYFSCVNNSGTNYYKEIPMFDFQNYTGYYDCK